MQNPAPTALRVAVVGGGCSGFQYHMAFENQTNETDEVADFDGLKGDESNEWDGRTFNVWTSEAMSPEAACLPNPDPNELFADMTEHQHR